MSGSLGKVTPQSTSKNRQKTITRASRNQRHPYRVREIAEQAGFSEATVDRVLNERGNVRESTVREIRQAIADLDRQRDQVRVVGRTFTVDVVMSAPARFTTAVREALEAELAFLRPVLVRCRFHLKESASVEAVVEQLDKIRRRGSHGVVVKAPDDPEVRDAIDRLDEARIPVVTLVTDLPSSRRRAYVGMDNRAAGQTAAYLVSQWSTDPSGAVLVTLSSSAFRGEEERESGFRSAMRRLAPGRDIVELSETDGIDDRMRELVADVLSRRNDIKAVYSIGGGNTAIVEAFADSGRELEVFVAHDLDDDNSELIRRGSLSAVLHHDLHQDMRRACQVIVAAHGAIDIGALSTASAIQVVTPYNISTGSWVDPRKVGTRSP
jgi:LacI family transcriptional regulator